MAAKVLRLKIIETEKRHVFKNIICLLSFFSLIVFCFHAEAQRHEGPITRASGGAGRAAVDPSESFLLNPASVVHLKGYHLAGYYSSEFSREFGKNEGFGFAIADNSPGNMFAAAVAYFANDLKQENQETTKQKDVLVTIGDFIYERLSIGFSFEHFSHDMIEKTYWENRLHVGFIFTPTDNLGLSLTGYNVYSNQHMANDQGSPKSWALGAAYTYRSFFLLKCDAEYFPDINGQSKVNTYGGFDSSINQWLVFRMGARDDKVNANTIYAFGFGFLGPRLRLDYTFEQAASSPLWQRHNVGVHLPF